MTAIMDALLAFGWSVDSSFWWLEPLWKLFHLRWSRPKDDQGICISRLLASWIRWCHLHSEVVLSTSSCGLSDCGTSQLSSIHPMHGRLDLLSTSPQRHQRWTEVTCFETRSLALLFQSLLLRYVFQLLDLWWDPSDSDHLPWPLWRQLLLLSSWQCVDSDTLLL